MRTYTLKHKNTLFRPLNMLQVYFYVFTIELEGNLTKFPDLSHHRAYRSVHGGSINLTSNTPFGVVI